jgi:hypothetical protein
VEKKGTTRSNADPKMRKRRDPKKLLLQKKIYPRKKEGMFTWNLQENLHIMRQWLVESGASFHMTLHMEWFFEYERHDGGNFFLGDYWTTRIIGRGKFKLRLIDGRIRTIPGVLHIQGLDINLISVSKMDNAGVKKIFEKETCRVVRGEMVLLKGVQFGTLYKLKGSTISDGCSSSISLEKMFMLWHQILGHIREKGLRLLHSKGMVEGMSNCSLDFDFCEHCVYGKHNQVIFPFGAMRAERVLQLVHSDVFGPVSVPSLGKLVYYVSFIDEFSRNTWIYFLRKKSKVFDRFKEFKALVYNQTEKRIKVLRTDNVESFAGMNLNNFVRSVGIERKNTTPYTPQKNGVEKG